MADARIGSHIKSAGWVVSGLLIVTGLVALTFSLPSPEPADAPDDVFSAARAMRVVRTLTEEIGMRQNGTPAHARAAEYLAGELRKLSGVTVEVQRVGGVAQYGQDQIPFPPFVYETLNVVARIEGESEKAVLLNAHYDTLSDSVGAGDDAMGVAAIVETARVLAQGPKPRHSVVICLNGAEEMGLLGAAGFLKHRFAKDVRAYIYLDGGPGGKPVVIGAGPGNPWLLRAFAAAAPSPAVTVVAEDIIDSGLLPHSGDFVPFHEAGLVGIDFAAIGDFWAIHTPLDRAERIDPGTFQRMGDSLLAGTRGLLESGLEGNADKQKHVYYDILGLAVPVYSHTTARALAGVVLLLVAVSLVLSRRKAVPTFRQIVGALGRVTLMSFASFLAAILVAALLAFAIGRPHGWFASPWVGIVAFGFPAVAAALGVLSWRRRNLPDVAPMALWAGALLFWSFWLLMAAVSGAGSGYIPLWWAGFGAIGFIGALYKPSWRNRLWLASFIPPGALTLEMLAPLYPFAIADIGLVSAPAPLDMLIAAMVGIMALAQLPLLLVPLAGMGRLARAALAFLALTVIAVIIAAVRSPYSPERPKRVSAAVTVRDGKCRLLLGSKDALAIDPVLETVKDAEPYDFPWSPVPGLDPPFTHQLEAAPPDRAPPEIEVVSSTSDPARKLRKVKIRLVTGDPRPQLRLFIQREHLKAWSIGKIPEKSIDEKRMLVVFHGAPPERRELDLTFEGQKPVELELIEVRGPSRAPEMQAFAKKLPLWTALHAQDIWSVTKKI